MLKACARLGDGRILVVLGITDANVDQLKQGDPIYFDTAQLRFQPGDTVGAITVFYGATEHEVARAVRTLIGPGTEVIAASRGPGRPQ